MKKAKVYYKNCYLKAFGKEEEHVFGEKEKVFIKQTIVFSQIVLRQWHCLVVTNFMAFINITKIAKFNLIPKGFVTLKVWKTILKIYARKQEGG